MDYLALKKKQGIIRPEMKETINTHVKTVRIAPQMIFHLTEDLHGT